MSSFFIKYLEAWNHGDVQNIVNCFDDHAVVIDACDTFRDKAEIYNWVTKTIENGYFFEFIKGTITDHEVILGIKVSGNFKGSPIVQDHRFKTKDQMIVGLNISKVSNK